MIRAMRIFSAMALLALVISGCSSDNNPVSPTLTSTGPLAQAAHAIPADATIDSARVMLFATTSDAQTVSFHRVTAAWDEASLTFNSLVGNFDATPFTSLALTDSGWYSVDVTAEVNGWFDSTVTNNGFLIAPQADTTLSSLFASKERSSNAPYLIVCYTTFEGPSCDTLEVIDDGTVYTAQPDQNASTDTTLLVEREPGPDSVYYAAVQFDFPVEVRYASLGDRVWLDLNNNGVQDAEEAGIADVLVTLHNCADSGMVAMATTDADGLFLFDSLMAGDYYIELVAPDGHEFSPLDQGGDDAADSDVDSTGRSACVTLMPGEENADLDIGLVPFNSSLGDFVWLDDDKDGIQDPEEVGVAGVEIMLYSCATDSMIASTTSDADGFYVFESLFAGDYYITVTPPADHGFSPADQGGDDTIDSDIGFWTGRSDCVTLAASEENTDLDIGLALFDACTRGKGYWKNHAGFGPQADVVSAKLPIWLGTDGGANSLAVTDAQIAFDVLQQHTYGHPKNGITKLYAHLLTAKLNIANYANPADIADAIDEADAFLADYSWEDWDSLSKEQQQWVNQWKGMSESYNEGEIGPGSCDDDDHDDGDDDDDYDDDDSGTDGSFRLFGGDIGAAKQ